MKRLVRPDNFDGHVTAFFTGRDPGADLAEISRICHVEEERIYLPVQRHTDTVHIVTADIEPKIADAVVTKRKDLLIGIQVADCVPILLYDRYREAVGAVHAGWRGTAAGILKNTIRIFVEHLSSSPGDILVAIGPSIRQCSYEVDPDVAHAVERASGHGDFVIRKGTKYHVDLSLANRYQALSEGIRDRNIWVSTDCTFCNPEIYCSYRYAKGTTCRQAGFIGMVGGK